MGSTGRAHIEDWEGIEFSFGAEPVPRWERACQGGVKIYAHFVEDVGVGRVAESSPAIIVQ